MIIRARRSLFLFVVLLASLLASWLLLASTPTVDALEQSNALLVSTIVGETGTVLLNNTIDGSVVATVNTTNSYIDPIVVAFINTGNGSESIDVRVRNVTSSSFEIFTEEPDDQTHAIERVSYIVMERGRYTLDGNIVVEAGSVDTNSVHVSPNAFGGASITFAQPFATTPAVLHTLNTYNNGEFMSSVAYAVTTSGFTVQQEAAESGHQVGATNETIGWIAFSTGTGTTNSSAYEIGFATDGTDDGVDDTPHTITFSSFTTYPDVVVKGNSGNGTDGYWARGGTYTTTTQTVFAEEDQVFDTERAHLDETFAWAAFDPDTVFIEICSNPIYVDIDATGANNGTSWTDAFTSLNDALDATASCSGYAIWIAEGVYYPDLGTGRTDNDPSQSFILSSDVTLYGGFNGTETALAQRDVASYVTILSGDIDENDTTTGGVVTNISNLNGINSYHVISGTAVSNVMIDGLTITAGKSGGSGADQNGAALYLLDSTATLNQVTVSGNHATGTGQGSIHGYDTDLTVTNSSFSNNRAVDGGAIYSQRTSGIHMLRMTDSSFTFNRSTDTGGAIYVEGAQLINVTDSAFTSNHAQDSGGAVYLYAAGAGTWKNVSFVGNRGETGGGAILILFGQGQTIETALFSGNHTLARGGAIYNDRVNLTVINATFHGNRAIGVYGGLQQGGGIYLSDTSNKTEIIENSIFWGNLGETGIYSATEQIEINDTSTVAPVIRYSNIQNSGGSGAGWYIPGATDGGNNIDSDPLFVTNIDPTTTPTTAGDSQLQFNSPAVNSGNDTVVTVSTDLAGNARLNGTVDMGAYEVLSRCFVETTGNNVTDYDSVDASAVQEAVNNAGSGDVLKIAGTCTGVQTQGGTTQTIYINQSLTLQGGYTTTNWTTTSDPATYPTTLDAEGNGRVVTVGGGVGVTVNVEGLILINGDASLASVADQGGGLLVGANTTVNVTDSQVNDNLADLGGGAFVESGATFIVTNSTFDNNQANTSGGGIYNDNGTLTIRTSSQIINNVAAGDAVGDGGGGVYNNGSLTLSTSSHIDYNMATGASGSGGGVFFQDGTFAMSSANIDFNAANATGGGVEMVNGTGTFLGNTRILNNDVNGSAGTTNPGNGGGMNISGSASVSFNNTIVGSNQAANAGGAFAIESGGSLTLISTQTDGNQAHGNGGGGIYNNGGTLIVRSGAGPTTINGNNATMGAGGAVLSIGGSVDMDSNSTSQVSNLNSNQAATDGGAIAMSGGTLYMSQIILNNNTATDNGGGIWLDGTAADLSYTEIKNSDADNGGGIYNAGTLTVTHSTLMTNTAVLNGGALDNFGTAIFVNSTLSGHQAGSNGGAIEHDSGSLALLHTTIANNTGGTGDGIYANTALNMMNSIVADNGTTNCVFGAGASMVSGGYNVVDDTTCGLSAPTDLENKPAQLAPIADNGGETWTHALLNGSAAVNQIPSGVNGCGTTYTTDQRDEARPQFTSCDIGAYEATTLLDSTCAVEATGDDVTDYSSADASAIQDAINGATSGDTLKIAGTCEGVQIQGGTSQTAYINKELTLIGGYDTSDWTTSNPDLYPTTLDAQNAGRVVRIASGTYTVTLTSLDLTNGTHATGGGVLAVGANLTVNISNTHVYSNSSSGVGGGLYFDQVQGTIEDSQIYSNTSASSGAGIYNTGSSGLLTVDNSWIFTNTVTSNSDGAGIGNNGNLILTNTTIEDNLSGRQGGGIANFSGASMSINNSWIISNTATTFGGAILHSGILSIDNTTISYNQASAQGGAIHASGVLTITNSLMSYNQANGGGGLSHVGGVATLENTTISQNVSDGAYSWAGAVQLTLNHVTIISNTTRGINHSSGVITATNTVVAYNNNVDCNGTVGSGGYNLASDSSCTGFVNTGDLQSVDPLVGALGDNGGNTWTHALLDNSPAFNQIPGGVNGCGTTYTTDQRGEVRPQFVACDIGAYESTTLLAAACSVEATGDNITDYASPDASAVQWAVNNASAGDTLKIAGTCTGVQTQGGFVQTVYISQSLTLQGGYTHTNWLTTPNANTYPTTLDADNGGRVAYLTGGSSVTMTHLIVTNGNWGSGSGGGILMDGTTLVLDQMQVLSNTTVPHGGGVANNAGNLTVTNSTFENNLASGSRGGAIYNNDGDTTINSSTFYNNSAANGGALYNLAGTLTVINSTISHNEAFATQGGGIYSNANTNIIHTTIVSNTAGTGGGIRRTGGTTNLTNSIVAYNSSANCAGTVVDNGYNLISDGGCNISMTTSLSNTDPLLTSLADNGGNTWTHALATGSLAIDTIPAGTSGCGTTYTIDQRGMVRPQGVNCDMGAYEFVGAAITVPLTLTIADGGSTIANLTWTNDTSQCLYELYRSTTPYSGYALYAGNWHTPLYDDAGAIGDTATNYYYYVVAYNCGNSASTTSNDVAEFDFVIVPGS